MALNKVELSPDGTRFAGLTIEGITIYDTATEEKVDICSACPDVPGSLL